MWNDDWRDELKIEDPSMYERLCECRNKKSDLKKLAKLLYKYNINHAKSVCLDRIIEWITDWNNQVELIPDKEEYDKILEYM